MPDTTFTAQSLVDLVREKQPVLWGKQNDAEVFSNVLRSYPAYAEHISDLDKTVFDRLGGFDEPMFHAEQRNVNEDYTQGGYDPSWKDHLNAAKFNFIQMGLEIPNTIFTIAAAIGNTQEGYDRAKEWRERGRAISQMFINADPELQAYLKWAEAEPVNFKNFYQKDMVGKSLANLAPSMALMLVSGGIASTALKVIGGGARLFGASSVATKAVSKWGSRTVSFLTMAAMEGSEVAGYAVEELQKKGVPIDKAYDIAAQITSAHGLVAGSLEFMQLHGLLGFLKKGSQANKLFVNTLMGKFFPLGKLLSLVRWALVVSYCLDLQE